MCIARTLYDKQRGRDDARDDVRSEALVDALVVKSGALVRREALVDALVVPGQLDDRQVTDVLQRSC